jgi:sortase (surface protein transpeptidase)|tara:strand:+ start:67 stop:300 length:234 start_codon:yes stop_codon:yes gene_type:complete
MKKYLIIFAIAGLMVSFSGSALFANNSVNTEMSTEKEKKEKKKKKKKGESSDSKKKDCSVKEGSGSVGCCHGAKKAS